MLADGRLVAAAEEDRFRRIKHWTGFPSQAIQYCLSEAGIALRDVEHVAIKQDPRAHLLRKIAYTMTRRPDPRFVADRLRNKRRRASVAQMLERTVASGFAGVVHPVEQWTCLFSGTGILNAWE